MISIISKVLTAYSGKITREFDCSPLPPAGHCSYYFLVGSEPRFACVISCSSCLFRLLSNGGAEEGGKLHKIPEVHMKRTPDQPLLRRLGYGSRGVHPRVGRQRHIIQTNRVCTKSASVKAPLKFYY